MSSANSEFYFFCSLDALFLSQINEWRVALSNELYAKGGRYASLEVLNDVVQEFINQIVFLRICEDKNLPLYHNLKDTVADVTTLHNELEELFRSADRRYNSGMFSGDDIIFDLSCGVIQNMIFYGPSGTGKSSMLIEPMIARDLEKKFFFREIAKEMGYTALKTGLATLDCPYSKEYLNKNFNLNMLTPVTGKEKVYNAYMKKMIYSVTPDKITYRNLSSNYPSEIMNEDSLELDSELPQAAKVRATPDNSVIPAKIFAFFIIKNPPILGTS